MKNHSFNFLQIKLLEKLTENSLVIFALCLESVISILKFTHFLSFVKNFKRKCEEEFAMNTAKL